MLSCLHPLGSRRHGCESKNRGTAEDGSLRSTSLVTESLVFVIRLYQAVLSPVAGTQCRFIPSCSNYAIEAVRLFGPAKGGLLAFKRILRCQPFGPKGFDPPPDRLKNY